MSKSLLNALFGIFLILTCCNCGQNLPEIENREVHYINTSTKSDQEQKDYFTYISYRTVLIKQDCAAIPGTVFIAPPGFNPEKSFDAFGTGVILKSSKGKSFVATANHVVTNDFPEGLTCKTYVVQGEKEYLAKIEIKSYIRDLGIISVQEDLKVDSELDLEPYLGEKVWSCGYPMQMLAPGQHLLSVSEGVVATLNIPANMFGISVFHRVTAQIYFGNSGGGVWSGDGKLTGISVALLGADKKDGPAVPYEGQYFIKPAAEIVLLIKEDPLLAAEFGIR